MARIRTVKPDLWTDPEFTECSLSARLLLIASFNFASDFGVLPDKPKQLKMQCFPGDNCDIDALVTELVDKRFYVRRTAPTGENVLVIRTFTQHQKINRPSPGRWGDPDKWPEFTESSVNVQGGLTEDSPPEGKGREGIIRKGRETSSSSERTVTDALRVVVDDDDDFQRTLDKIADARMKDRAGIGDTRAYRAGINRDTKQCDGELIRRMLHDGTPPDAVAMFVLGHGIATTSERTEQSIPWCTPDCPTCQGDAWIDTGNGLAPCPERTPRTETA